MGAQDHSKYGFQAWPNVSIECLFYAKAFLEVSEENRWDWQDARVAWERPCVPGFAD